MQEAAIGIIFSEDRLSVLLVQRKDVEIWVLPGGGIDREESPEEAVKREIFEETGLQVSVCRKIGEYTPINRLSSFTHLFECTISGGEAIKSSFLQNSSETRDVGFYLLTDLPENLFFLHREWLQDGLKNRPEIIKKPISITYQDVFRYLCRHPLILLRYLWTRCTKSH